MRIFQKQKRNEQHTEHNNTKFLLLTIWALTDTNWSNWHFRRQPIFQYFCRNRIWLFCVLFVYYYFQLFSDSLVILVVFVYNFFCLYFLYFAVPVYFSLICFTSFSRFQHLTYCKVYVRAYRKNIFHNEFLFLLFYSKIRKRKEKKSRRQKNFSCEWEKSKEKSRIDWNEKCKRNVFLRKFWEKVQRNRKKISFVILFNYFLFCRRMF